MLSKVLKYDMRATGRILLPVYAAMLAAALLFGLSMGVVEKTGSSFLQVISGVIYVGVIIAAVVLTVIMIITRFYHSMMGDEGYLTHVLPVGTGTLIAAKTISASLWGCFGTIAGILSAIVLGIGVLITGIITGEIKDFHIDFSELYPFLTGLNYGQIILITVLMIGTVMFGAAAGIGRVYTSISIGHLWTNHRIAGAILAYIGIGIILQTFVFGAAFGVYVLPFDSVNHFFFGDGGSGTDFYFVLLISIVISAILTVIYSLISWVILKKHLNLQ